LCLHITIAVGSGSGSQDKQNFRIQNTAAEPA